MKGIIVYLSWLSGTIAMLLSISELGYNPKGIGLGILLYLILITPKICYDKPWKKKG